MPLPIKCSRCNLGFGIRDPKCPQGPRMPLMLDCGHTFCSDCLTKLAKLHRTSIICPTCQYSTPLLEESSVKSLWPDVYVHGLLAVNRSPSAMQPQMMEFLKTNTSAGSKAKPKQHLCQECSVKPATCRCTKCDHILCGTCFDKIHRVSKLFRQHQAEVFNSMGSEIDYGQNYSLLCSSHSRPIEFYCENEDVALCGVCISQTAHKDHVVVSIEDKEKTDLADLNLVLGEASDVLQHSKRSLALIEAFVPASQSHGKRLIENIQHHFVQLHALLQSREHCLINELVKSFNGEIEPLSKVETDLMEQIRKLEKVIGDARAVVAGTKKRVNGRKIMECLRKIIDIPCYAVIGDGGNLQIQFKCEDDKLLDEIKSHGQLDGLFVNGITLEKLRDISVMTEDGDRVPLVLTCNGSNSSVSSTNVTEDMGYEEKNGISDLDSVSLSTNLESVCDQDTKEKARTSSGLRYKIRSELVHVSHIYSPCSFYVNLNRDIQNLTNLSRSINVYCSHIGKNDIPHTVDVGDIVLAQYSEDGQWYRAELLEVNEVSSVSLMTTVKVLYTDYGNKELTTLDRIRNMNSKFMHLPPMAQHCSLLDIIPLPENGSRWPSESITTFARITKDRPMIMSVIQEMKDLWYVDLSRPASSDIEDDGPLSVRDAMVFLNLACFVTSHTMPSTSRNFKQRRYLTPLLPQCGDSVRVLLTYVATPHDFYVQMIGSESRSLQDLMVSLQKTYNDDRGDLYTLYCPTKGILCVAKYELDDFWYRAEVVELIGSGRVKIRYIDYGNIEAISVLKLKKLLDVFAVLPAMAVHCQLADISPLQETGVWQMEAIKYLRELMNETELNMKVKEVINRSTLTVYLHIDTMHHSVNTSMISFCWAKASGPGWEPPRKTPKSLYLIAKNKKAYENKNVFKHEAQVKESVERNRADTNQFCEPDEKPQWPLVTVSHIVSPGEFYVQDTTKMKELQQFMGEINKHVENGLPSEDLNVGDLKLFDVYVAENPEDQRFYRAQVTKLEKSTAEVFVIDYGYKFMVELSNLHSLQDSLKSRTRFTVRCHFADITPAGDIQRWSQTSCETFKSLVSDKACYLSVKGNNLDENGSLPVDLLLEVLVKGGPITPDITQYESISKCLRDKGLALRRRTSVTELTAIAALMSTSSLPIEAPSLPIEAPNEILLPSDETCSEHNSASSQNDSLESMVTDYPAIELPTSQKLILGVTHVDNNGIIFGQEIKQDLTYLHELMTRVQKHYKDSPPSIGGKWNEGELVVAQYTGDNGFYRAKVISIKDNMAEVYYADYGNTELISTERLRPAIFVNEPAQCYKCILHGISWKSDDGSLPEGVSSFLNEALVGQLVSVLIMKSPESGSLLIVEMTFEGKDLSEIVCERGFAVKSKEEPPSISPDQNVSLPQSPSVSSTLSQLSVVSNSPLKMPPLLPSSLNMTNHHHMDTTSITDPDLDPANASELLLHSCDSFSDIVQNSKTNSMPTINSAHGNSTSISESNSTSISESCNKDLQPPASIDMPLACPHPSGYGSWIDESNVPPACCVSHRIPERKVPSPYLSLPEPTVDDMLIMTVTQIDAPNVVYLQRVKLNDLTEEHVLEANGQLDHLLQMNLWYGTHSDECSVLTMEEITPGCPCIAKYSDDGCWYRAEIIDMRTAGGTLEVDVLFVDYGSNDCIKERECLRTIPAEHMLLPSQARLCHLDGIQPRDNWGQDDIGSLFEVVKDKILITTVKNVENGVVSVDLFDQEAYKRDGVIAPLIYQRLLDNGLVSFTATDAIDVSASEDV